MIRIINKGITSIPADIIVNAANDGLRQGGGVCGVIFREAGARELTKACQEVGHCNTGNVVKTPAFALDAKYIFHAVGPIWGGGSHGEAEQLKSCYTNALALAKECDCHSIVFPLISAGIYGYPKEGAWRQAIAGCREFEASNPSYEIEIIFAVLDPEIIAIGEKVLEDL